MEKYNTKYIILPEVPSNWNCMYLRKSESSFEVMGYNKAYKYSGQIFYTFAILLVPYVCSLYKTRKILHSADTNMEFLFFFNGERAVTKRTTDSIQNYKTNIDQYQLIEVRPCTPVGAARRAASCMATAAAPQQAKSTKWQCVGCRCAARLRILS